MYMYIYIHIGLGSSSTRKGCKRKAEEIAILPAQVAEHKLKAAKCIADSAVHAASERCEQGHPESLGSLFVYVGSHLADVDPSISMIHEAYHLCFFHPCLLHCSVVMFVWHGGLGIDAGGKRALPLSSQFFFSESLMIAAAQAKRGKKSWPTR